MEMRVAEERQEVWSKESTSGEASRRMYNPVNIYEVSELLIGPGRQVQPGTACLL